MSWQNLKLGEFLINRENRFKPNDKSISGLKRIDKIDFSGKIFLSNKPSNTDMILVKKGDLVISGINVEKGAMSVYQGEEDVIATIHYSSYTFNEKKIDIGFLKLFLRSPEFKSALKEQVPGGIKTEIKPKHLLHLEVVIPNTVSEQKEVVNSFSKLETQNFNLENELSYQDNLLAQLRKAFLRDAIQGKLAKQSSKDGNGNDLLEKIKAEKEKRKNEKELPSIKEEEIPFDIPENWVWCRLGEIAYIASGSTPSKDAFVSKGIPYLKMYNLKNQQIAFDYKPQFIKEDVHNGQLKRSRTQIGDVMMNIVGPPLGKLAIIPESLPEANFNQAGVLIRPHLFKDMNKWIYYYLNEMSEINSISTKGIAGQDNISITQSNNIKIPLPPLAEQKRIVKKLEEVMNLCDELKTTITDNQNYTDQLLQVALKDALQPKEMEAV